MVCCCLSANPYVNANLWVAEHKRLTVPGFVFTLTLVNLLTVICSLATLHACFMYHTQTYLHLVWVCRSFTIVLLCLRWHISRPRNLYKSNCSQYLKFLNVSACLVNVPNLIDDLSWLVSLVCIFHGVEKENLARQIQINHLKARAPPPSSRHLQFVCMLLMSVSGWISPLVLLSDQQQQQQPHTVYPAFMVSVQGGLMENRLSSECVGIAWCHRYMCLYEMRWRFSMKTHDLGCVDTFGFKSFVCLAPLSRVWWNTRQYRPNPDSNLPVPHFCTWHIREPPYRVPVTSR